MVEVPEVLEAPGATNHARAVMDPGADDSTPAGPQAGNCTTPAQAIASPAALPTVPPTVHLQSAWLISSLMNPLLVLTGQPGDHPSRQCKNLVSSQRFPVDWESIQQPSLVLHKAAAPHEEWYQADDCEDQPWCSGDYHPPEQVPEAFPSHDGKPKPFLGHFIAEVQHTTLPRSYPVWFYVFENATSPHILLFYTTLERLGILEFKVPNLAAQSQLQIDNLSVPSSPTLGSLRKTTKHVTLCDPLIDMDQPCSIPHAQGLSGLRKTTAHKVSFQESSSTITGTQHKSPSNPTSKPIQALKQHIPYTPKSKNNFCPQGEDDQGDFSLHYCHGSRHNCPEGSLPSFLWHHREYVWDLYHQDWP